MFKKVSYLIASLVVVAACSNLEKKPNVSSNHFVYPDSDDLQIKEFTQAVFPDAKERKPSSRELNLPKDYSVGKIFTVIKEPGLLQEIERRGLTFAYHLENQNKETVLNSDLIRTSSRYQSMVQIIDNDINELMKLEKQKRGQNSVGVGIRYPFRIFDAKWMKSKIANYQLVGIMNRIDRVAFNSHSCGEIRLVYRLGYDQGPKGIQSRLPMTFMVKYKVPGESYPNANWNLCKRLVKNWTYPDISQNPDNLVNWMFSNQGPLSPEYFSAENLQSVELNMQAFRIPSSMRPEFGGHGNYLMRVFNPDDQAMVPSKLENTPDVDKILANPSLLSELKTMMKDRHVVNRIDAGILKLDDKFLAEKAYSFSPMGLSRKDNRLFHKLLSESDFSAEQFARNRYVKTPEAAIRRLNDMSCVGCHQGRATAGFHFLGIDRKDTHAFNALEFEGSGHFQLELIRRNKYMQRVAQNLVPDPNRDFSFAPPEGTKAGQGHFCGLPGSKEFAHWQCADGMSCLKVDGVAGDDILGKCFPKVLSAGAPCVVGTVSQKDHRVDALENLKSLNCGDGRRTYGCSQVKGGFPSGMCNTQCANLNSSEVCAQIAGAGFTECVAKGRPFEQCLDGAGQSGRGACNDDISCRNDYVCGRTFRSTNGNCTPSYFLFQIRLDGHPDPVL